jgi:hypothetical protein
MMDSESSFDANEMKHLTKLGAATLGLLLGLLYMAAVIYLTS